MARSDHKVRREYGEVRGQQLGFYTSFEPLPMDSVKRHIASTAPNLLISCCNHKMPVTNIPFSPRQLSGIEIVSYCYRQEWYLFEIACVV